MPPPPVRPALSERLMALLEVLICSDYPTQLLLGWALLAFGYLPQNQSGTLALGYVVALSLADTVVLMGLIVVFLKARGERPLDILLGNVPLAPELMAGARLALVSFAVAIAILLTIQVALPSLHTVPHNPLQDLIGSPRDTLLFGFVIVVAGGIREEIQRAFLLHRFEHFLGGRTVGVIVVSVGFGAGHLIQGVDAAIVTGMLGAIWGVAYLKRRSAVAPIVSHSGFNLLQLGQFLLGR